jgi:ketosteroid isomerase-like protein
VTSGAPAAGPQEVIERLLAGIAVGATPALAELYAESAVVELPFAQPGGLRLVGREQIAQHFARAGRAPFRLRPINVTLHQTSDPELVVVEYDYQGEIRSTGDEFIVANVQIVRVRDGLILSSRDFHDHAGMAAAARNVSSAGSPEQDL